MQRRNRASTYRHPNRTVTCRGNKANASHPGTRSLVVLPSRPCLQPRRRASGPTHFDQPKHKPTQPWKRELWSLLHRKIPRSKLAGSKHLLQRTPREAPSHARSRYRHLLGNQGLSGREVGGGARRGSRLGPFFRGERELYPSGERKRPDFIGPLALPMG